jgi:hypothetical protein
LDNPNPNLKDDIEDATENNQTEMSNENGEEEVKEVSLDANNADAEEEKKEDAGGSDSDKGVDIGDLGQSS